MPAAASSKTAGKASAEKERLAEDKGGTQNWRRWGPYVSERQWGTVREDYSPNRDAWDDLPHDHARSRAYRWGEDGIASFSDDRQRLCLSLALWNGKDPILKEQLFGLTNGEAITGRTWKGYITTSTPPSHSYLDAMSARRRVSLHAPSRENARRSRDEKEFSCSTPVCSMRTATSCVRARKPRRRYSHISHGPVRPGRGETYSLANCFSATPGRKQDSGPFSSLIPSSRPTRTFGTTSCSTNILTATPAAESVRRTRPAGPAWWPTSSNPVKNETSTFRRNQTTKRQAGKCSNKLR
jgi:hypothetical protein